MLESSSARNVAGAVTIPDLFCRRVAATPERTALHIKVAARGAEPARFQPVSWQQLAADVRQLAHMLLELGVRPGDRVAQWSENCYGWIVTDLAVQAVGAIHVPLHAPLTASQALYQIRHSGATATILQGQVQCDKIMTCPASELPRVVWLTHEPVTAVIQGQPVTWTRCNVPGTSTDELLKSPLAEVDSDAPATILYTSGTTGDPKGVVLTHRNLVSNVQGVLAAFQDQESDLRLSFLPLSHVFARTCDLYVSMASGCELALAGSRETVMEDIRAMAPTLINGVPYFYERVHRRLVEVGQADRPGALKGALGGRMRACCSGGAALADHTYDYFQSQEMPVLQGYGLTETSPVITVSTESDCRRGCVGRVIDGVEVRIASDGEILTRGPHVMAGYWNDDASTAAVLRDGWLHTGDLGQMEVGGFLRITGRKKEILVLSSGKNIAPVCIESRLCRDPFIEQAIVVGDNRRYLVALIVPCAKALQRVIREQRLWVWSKRRAVTHPRVRALYRERIQQQLADLSPHEQVREFEILDRGFTIEAGHVTPKASLCRDKIAADFATHIDALYRKCS